MNWKRPALAGLAVVLAYINANLVISASARASVASDAIALPVPARFWARDLVVELDSPDGRGFAHRRWRVDSPGPGPPRLLARRHSCLHPARLRQFAPHRRDLAAFLFWSRAPYIDVAEVDGQTVDVLRDARFARSNRFSVTVPVPVDAESCLLE